MEVSAEPLTAHAEKRREHDLLDGADLRPGHQASDFIHYLIESDILNRSRALGNSPIWLE